MMPQEIDISKTTQPKETFVLEYVLSLNILVIILQIRPNHIAIRSAQTAHLVTIYILVIALHNVRRIRWIALTISD